MALNNLHTKQLMFTAGWRGYRLYIPLGDILFEDVPSVELMYLLFTRMSDESYSRRFGPLLFQLLYM